MNGDEGTMRCMVCEVLLARRGIRHSRARGVTGRPSLRLTVCPACHRRIHADPDGSRRRGWLIGDDQDPTLTPVLVARLGWVRLGDDGTATPLTVGRKDAWLRRTGLKWSVERLDPMVGQPCTVTDSRGRVHRGSLTAVTEDPDGVTAVTLDMTRDWRLEDGVDIRFEGGRRTAAEPASPAPMPYAGGVDTYRAQTRERT